MGRRSLNSHGLSQTTLGYHRLYLGKLTNGKALHVSLGKDLSTAHWKAARWRELRQARADTEGIDAEAVVWPTDIAKQAKVLIRDWHRIDTDAVEGAKKRAEIMAAIVAAGGSLRL